MPPVKFTAKAWENTGPNPIVLLETLQLEFSGDNLKKDLAGVENRVLNATNTFINANRARFQEVHNDPIESWRASARNNLVQTLRLGTEIHDMGNYKWGLGIGREDILQQFAPYWYVVNFGHKITGTPYVPPQTYGYFGNNSKSGYPIANFSGGEAFHHVSSSGSGKRTWKIEPNKPIAPMHYLENMFSVFLNEMNMLEVKYKETIARAARNAKARKLALKSK